MKAKSEVTKRKDAERAKKWRLANLDYCKEKDRLKYLNHRDSIRARSKARYENHKAELISQQAERRRVKSQLSRPERQRKREQKKRETKQRWAKWQVEREKSRSKVDINYRNGRRLRSRLRNALKKAGARRSARMMTLLGCSLEFLKSHLESLFKDGMSWSNYGEWHIDHKRPCASFDLVLKEEQEKCFHWSNLQPLWARDNIRKSCHLDNY